jgi:anti-sigma factor RsiW
MKKRVRKKALPLEQSKFMNEHLEEDILSTYTDGELSASERVTAEIHLAACASCKAALASIQETKDVLKCAPRRAMPPELIAALEERCQPSRWEILKQWIHSQRVWIPVGAAATAVLFVGLWMGLQKNPEEESLPIETLIAAHERYSAEGLVPSSDSSSSEFSSQIAGDHAD